MNEFVKVPNTTPPFSQWVVNYINSEALALYDTKPSKEQMKMIIDPESWMDSHHGRRCTQERYLPSVY
jgi:hypothetical protein